MSRSDACCVSKTVSPGPIACTETVRDVDGVAGFQIDIAKDLAEGSIGNAPFVLGP